MCGSGTCLFRYANDQVTLAAVLLCAVAVCPLVMLQVSCLGKVP